MKYRDIAILACVAFLLALLVLVLGQLDSVEAEEWPVADFNIYSGDRELTLENDLIPSNQYIDIFYGDVIGLSEQAYDPDGSITQETMAWSFQDGPVVLGEETLNFTVGWNVSFPGRNHSVQGPVFGAWEPASPHLYWLRFEVTDEKNLSNQSTVTFQVHPYARHDFTFNFSHLGENLSAEATLCWRGFEEEAVTSFVEWGPGKVYVGMKLVGAQVPQNRLPLNSWLDMNYLLEVRGCQLQNGTPGFRSIELKLPFTEESVARLGVFEALRGDVAAYRYDKVTKRYGPSGEDGLEGLGLAGGGNYLQGELVNGSQLFEWEEDLLQLELGLAIKSIWTGEKRPDLVLVDLRLDHSHMLVENVVNITATVELRGVVFVNQDVTVRFLGDSGETLTDVTVSFTKEDNQTQTVNYWYYIGERIGSSNYGEPPAVHVLSVKIDADLDVAETNETNNLAQEVLEMVECSLSGSSSIEYREMDMCNPVSQGMGQYLMAGAVVIVFLSFLLLPSFSLQEKTLPGELANKKVMAGTKEPGLCRQKQKRKVLTALLLTTIIIMASTLVICSDELVTREHRAPRYELESSLGDDGFFVLEINYVEKKCYATTAEFYLETEDGTQVPGEQGNLEDIYGLDLSCEPSYNLSFQDEDRDGYLSQGDYFLVRSVDAGGLASEGFRFRLFHGVLDETMGSVKLAA